MAAAADTRLSAPRSPWRSLLPLFADGRGTLIATAPVVWLGVALLPDLHSSLRLPAWIGLAAFVGLGSEVAARVAAPDTAWRRGSGTFWFVPAGTALLAIIWFSVFPDRPRSLAPLAVLVVIAAMVIQRVELVGPQPLRAGAHAISIGLAFAIAFVVYATSAHAKTDWSLALVAVATVFAALTLLRDARATRRSVLGLTAVTAIVVLELALVLAGGPAAPWVCAALLVLALYGCAGVSHATLEEAPRHVYVELLLVSAAGLVVVAVAAARV